MSARRDRVNPLIPMVFVVCMYIVWVHGFLSGDCVCPMWCLGDKKPCGEMLREGADRHLEFDQYNLGNTRQTRSIRGVVSPPRVRSQLGGPPVPVRRYGALKGQRTPLPAGLLIATIIATDSFLHHRRVPFYNECCVYTNFD